MPTKKNRVEASDTSGNAALLGPDMKEPIKNMYPTRLRKTKDKMPTGGKQGVNTPEEFIHNQQDKDVTRI